MRTIQTQGRRLYVSMNLSLDGYIEGSNGELDWFTESPQFDSYADEMLDSVGVALCRRRAYEVLNYWPMAETNPRSEKDLSFARRMNALLSRALCFMTKWTKTSWERSIAKCNF